MKAVLCVAHGDPSALQWTDVPAPQPQTGQVRIRVSAAAVNFPDALVITGRYQHQPPLPFSPGCEGAGVVSGLGDGVDRLAVGQRVLFSAPFGAFAEEVAVDQASVFPIPDDMPDTDAAGFLLAYATAYHALKQRGRLQPGETLLVLGAAGGVGLAAVELGVAMGATVIACASTPDKLEICKSRGAHGLLQYGSPETLKSQILDATGGKCPDVIYDPVGGDYAEPAFRTIAWEGRYLIIGFAGGGIPRLPLNLPLLKGASVVGVIAGTFMNVAPDESAENVDRRGKGTPLAV
ncbi:MAG: NADPH:quinone oxidoreductase [Sphingomonadales bacterium RIFCSPHIGHO2_01_FULL_65_20]|nr:MAG: NADPH:quinone oxidoreductase [Sphingomonadales bacterium RIFCSPHIGHO2_01_FULL_65_20]